MRDGAVRWSARVDGRALGLAFDAGRLLVSTDTGALYCFSNAAAEKMVVEKWSQPSCCSVWPNAWLRWRELSAAGRWSLTWSTAACARWRRRRSEHHRRSADADKVAAAREHLAKRGLYGHRVTVHLAGGNALPLTDYFANLIASESAWIGQGAEPLGMREMERLLQPQNGVAWLAPDADPHLANGLPGAGEWTHQYGNRPTPATAATRSAQRPRAAMVAAPARP